MSSHPPAILVAMSGFLGVGEVILNGKADWGSVGGSPEQRPPGPRAYVPTLNHSGSRGQVTPVLGFLAVVSQDSFLSGGKKKLTQPPRFGGK